MIALEARQPTLFSPGHPLIIALAAFISLILLLFLGGAGKTLGLAAFGIVAVVVIWWGVVYTTEHRSWLIFVLVLTDMLMASFFLPGTAQTQGHYLLDFIFCLPVIPFVWRSGILRQGGFRLYVIYFAWALITVLYSTAPVFSLGRLIRAVLVFSGICAIVTEVENAEDVTRVLRIFLAACASILAIVAASAIILPHHLTWGIIDPENLDPSDINRFHGIFNSPNHIGELMLVSAGTAFVCWRTANGGWQRLWFLLALTSSLGFAALANSRTPFIALAVGGLLYLLWRHGMRALLICTVSAVLLGAAVSVSGFDFSHYAASRNVSTLTGRTEIWQFVISRIADHPILGYGYAVEGQIFQSRYFPVWWGPWDFGPRSSLHDGYLSHAVGVGVPATLFWLFIVLRPWFSLFRQKDDPWGLKPIALLIVVPLLLHNLAESSVGDFIYEVGVLFGLTWAIAEKRRLRTIEGASAHRADALIRLPPAIAALSATLFICFALFAFPSCGLAHDYYVNSLTGSDLNSGMREQNALKTLQAVERLRPGPGDRVLLARGGIWRESLKIDPPWKGTRADPVTLGTYGSGPLSVITGTDLVNQFTSACNGTCYSAAITESVERVFVDGDGFSNDGERTPLADLTPGSWTWKNGRLYLRLHDGSAPMEHRIEVTTRRWGIRCWNCTNVVIDGIDVWGTWDDGINLDGSATPGSGASNITVRDCRIHDIGRGGRDEAGVQAGSTYARSIFVEHNQVFRIGLGRGLGLGVGGGGIGILFNRCTGCEARGNTVYDAGHIGIAAQVFQEVPGMPGPERIVIAANRINDCPGSIPGLDHADAIYLRSASNVSVEDNTIADIVSARAGAGNAIHIGPRCANVTVTRNRVNDVASGVYVDHDQRGSLSVTNNVFARARLFFVRLSDLEPGLAVFDHNSYTGGFSAAPFVVGANSSSLNFARWRASGQDANGNAR